MVKKDKTFHMNPFRLLFCSAILAATHAAAAAPQSADAGQFDIAGVRLGMDQAEAIAAITEKLQLDDSAIQLDPSAQVNPVTNTREPKYFTAKAGLTSVIVHFEPRVPYDKARPMVVGTVIYEQPWTAENVSAMEDAALAKYGQPSNGTAGVSYQWCLEPHSNPGFGCSQYQGPILELAGTKLRLHDIRYTNARIEFMNKAQSAEPVF